MRDEIHAPAQFNACAEHGHSRLFFGSLMLVLAALAAIVIFAGA